MPLLSCKLVRICVGNYSTKDGLFRIWHASEFHKYEDDVDTWYLHHRDMDEPVTADGFRTKWEAVEYLKKLYEEKPDCYFGNYT